jgi:hypothetical protein
MRRREFLTFAGGATYVDSSAPRADLLVAGGLRCLERSNAPLVRDPDGYIVELGQSNPGVAYG